MYCETRRAVYEIYKQQKKNPICGGTLCTSERDTLFHIHIGVCVCVTECAADIVLFRRRCVVRRGGGDDG